MSVRTCMGWTKFYFPCPRWELVAWCVSLVLIGALTFMITLTVSIETLSHNEKSPPLHGSGSAFAQPLYDEWFTDLYDDTRLQASYQLTGVNQALQNLQLSNNSFTFAGGELSLQDMPNTTLDDTYLQFPVAGASVQLIYNLGDSSPLAGPVNVTLDALVDIYRGNLTHWDDPRLLALNPALDPVGVAGAVIVPLHFLKENGATYIFTQALSNYSAWWCSHVSYGERVPFPATATSRFPILDDYDMIETILQTPYTLGYVLLPSVLRFESDILQEVNITTLGVCTQWDDRGCQHTNVLDVSLQQSMLLQYTVLSNGEVLAPVANWSCQTCWFFNGATFWYTLQEYSAPGCAVLQKDLQNMLTWLYSSPDASAATVAAAYFSFQGVALGTLQSNIQSIRCVAGDSHTKEDALSISGVVLAVVLLLFILLVLFRAAYGVYQRHQRLQHIPLAFSLQGTPVEITPLLISCQIDRKEISLSTQIGTGSFGEVFQGTWRGVDVAVKKILLPESTANQRRVVEDFFQEANLMSTLRHPNVIQFLGACLHKPHLYIVLELADRGSVYDLLSKPDIHLNWKRKINFCIDAAKGMLYLHSSTPPVIHRDLKTANLLVDKNWKVSVTDFGLSRVVDSKNTMTHCGTVEFCAPEVLKRSRYTFKADVYSYAICVWQIFTRSALFHNTPLYQLMRMVVHDRYRPPMDPKLFTNPLINLVERCWAHDPDKRPEFDEILRDLTHIREERFPPH